MIRNQTHPKLPLSDYLAQTEARVLELEPAILSLIPEKQRFERLRREAMVLTKAYPEPASRPAFFGLLVGIKDIFHADGFVTRAGSQLPAEVLQGNQAESVARLKSAGALILGKTVTTEFAYFTPGPTHNPHNPRHTPGGSSSGSAAAVAAGFCALALGTQTIGSIIRPASYCGVIGFKPTYDRISRAGVIPLAPSFDHVGFFSADLETAIRAARILFSDWQEPGDGKERPVLAIPDGPYLENASPEGLLHFEQVCKLLASKYKIVRLPVMSDFQAITERNDVIMSAEVAQVHKSWFERYEALYSDKLRQLIHRGQSVAPSQLHAAMEARGRFRDWLRQVMHDRHIDLWICPSATGPAPLGLESTGSPVMNLPWSQAGLPALNLPAGKNEDSLPMGLQLVADWGKDELLLTWAMDLNQVLNSGSNLTPLAALQY